MTPVVFLLKTDYSRSNESQGAFYEIPESYSLKLLRSLNTSPRNGHSQEEPKQHDDEYDMASYMKSWSRGRMVGADKEI